MKLMFMTTMIMIKMMMMMIIIINSILQGPSSEATCHLFTKEIFHSQMNNENIIFVIINSVYI